MELKTSTTSSWTAGVLPDEFCKPSLKAVMLFGPDQGGVFEFTRLASRSCGDFDIVSASSASIEELTCKLTSGSLFSDATSIRLDGAGEKQFELIRGLLDLDFADNARLIISAGDLKQGSKLRKLFSERSDSISVPLYLMQSKDIIAFAKRFFLEADMKFDASAHDALMERLSGDRALAARACETIVLHARSRGSSLIEYFDISETLDTIDERSLITPLDLALSSSGGEASIAISNRLNAGESFVGMLRLFSARLFRLRSLLELKTTPSNAISKAKPPIFWTERDLFKSLLSVLSLEKIDRILLKLDRAEFEIIEKGVPATIIMPALMLDISSHIHWSE